MKRQLDTETIADLLAFVRDLGLADVDAVDLSDAPNVADASTTVLRYLDGDGEHRISIYALGFGESGDARAAIVESMIARLDEATRDVDSEPYRADRLVVYALGARLPVAGIMWFAIHRNWGTHYDVPPTPDFPEMAPLVKWFWIGFFLPLIGLIALFVVEPRQ